MKELCGVLDCTAVYSLASKTLKTKTTTKTIDPSLSVESGEWFTNNITRCD